MDNPVYDMDNKKKRKKVPKIGGFFCLFPKTKFGNIYCVTDFQGFLTLSFFFAYLIYQEEKAKDGKTKKSCPFFVLVIL